MIASAKAGLRRLLPKNAFARGVSVLVGGTAGAQLLTVLAAPLLTRLYSPEDFGLLAVYASLLALIGVISSLRYELAIPLPEDDGEAANVAVLSLILVGISALLSGLLVWQLGPAIADMLGVPALAGYFWLLPVGVLLGGAYTVFNYWSVRTKRFSTIAGTRLRQALATVAIQLAAFKLGGIALLYAQVAGQSVGTTSLGRPALASAGFRQVSWRGIVKAAGRYRRFPIFTTWAGLFNTGGTQLPPVMIAAFFTAAGAGLYALAHRVLTLPLTLFGSALQSVFLSSAAEAYRNNQLAGKVRRLLNILTQIAVPPALILALTAPDLFALVFGEEWREAGVMAQWMTPWLVMQFCTGPLTIINAVAEKQHLGLIMQVQLFVVRVAMILLGAYYGDLLLTIVLFSVGSAVSYFVFLWVVLAIAGLPIKIFLGSLGKALVISLAIVTPILLFPEFMNDGSLALGVVSALALLIGMRFFALFHYQL
ncbi:oligosaccharide flippase family protein [Halochromatium roseum]|uniref:oligosaccharide flippase family protein n=1 Tax=Halochromatium roseum TaxID=391920 RepID=UPI0019136AF7|nr:oligosaccharide flippase family protein [Halochromatium roseum]MBK5940059.1 polysaccharide biosynthesis protein [Halochromatium roseum]